MSDSNHSIFWTQSNFFFFFLIIYNMIDIHDRDNKFNTILHIPTFYLDPIVWLIMLIWSRCIYEHLCLLSCIVGVLQARWQYFFAAIFYSFKMDWSLCDILIFTVKVRECLCDRQSPSIDMIGIYNILKTILQSVCCR